MTVTVCDVGPRDGLQNELTVLEPETRAELVNRLALTGLRRIEVTSFVSAARVPQMADAEAVVQGVGPNAAIEYAGLVLNGRGYERLRATGVDRVHFAFAVTETFNRRSAGASVADSLAAATEILGRARGDGLGSTVTLAVAFGCPFEGRVDSGRVLELAARVAAVGADEVAFADTIGVAVPKRVRLLVDSAAGLDVPLGVPATLQAEPPRQLANLRGIPIAIVSAEASWFSHQDAHTVAFLRQAGCDVEHLRLGEHGVHGNGNLMMLEKNNREALQPIIDWLESKEA